MQFFVKLVCAVAITALTAGCSNIALEKGDVPKITFEQGSYPNGQLLVSAQLLETIRKKPGVAIIDTRTSGYDNGHIPGSVNILWKDYTDSSSNLKPLSEIEDKLGQIGLDRNMTLIIYDDARTSLGAAGRIFWMLEYLGCKDVHILNGGWSQWSASKRGVDRSPSTLPATVFKATVRSNLLATTDQVAERLNDTEFAIIDARTDEEFNGWIFHNETRGGHIPGAVQIPYEWLYQENGTMLDHENLKNLFEMRGVTRNKEVTAYGTAGIRSSSVYFALRLLGYPKVSNYDASIYGWSADASRKMEKLPHYEKFVSASWVRDLINGRRPATYPGRGYLILESRYLSSATTGAKADSARIDYIPGAVSIHPCYFEHENNTAKYYPLYSNPVDGNLLPPDRLKKAIERLGITRETTVIVYGSGVIIPMTAARVAWALMYAGVEDVRILNGGYPAWCAIGGPTESQAANPSPVDFGGTVPAHPEYYASMKYVQNVVSGKSPKSVMVDVRKKEENLGRLNPYPFFTAVGKIPGALWMGDWTELVDMNDSTFRCYTEVRAIWEGLGITADMEPIFYCGTGWRSSIGFYTAYAMGFEKLRNYDGSFYEWSWYPENATK